MSALEKLLEISSDPLTSKNPPMPSILRDARPEQLEELFSVLDIKNGFFAFENALLVLPSEPIGDVPGIEEWNLATGWRRRYCLSDDVLFFGLDLFANQFGISRKGVVRLDSESGDVSLHSSSIEEWAKRILDDYDFETGWSIGKEWQEDHGPLAPGYRLLGRKPFLLGGDYDASNLVPVQATEAAEKLGLLCEQVRSVPDGQKVRIHGWIAQIT